MDNIDNVEQCIKEEINNCTEELEFICEPIGDMGAEILANHLKGSRFTSLILVDNNILFWISVMASLL